MDFWLKLVDTSDFPPRWYCGNWTDGHGWLHIISDLAVFSAYFAIPGILIYFIRQRRDLPFRRIFLLFGAFILFCGMTHLMEAVIFWWPAYRLAGVMKFLTAVVSWLTVIALIRVAPTALAMRSPAELEREIAARKTAEAALEQSNTELEQRVLERTNELQAVNAELAAERGWLSITLTSIGDAVITTDTEGRVMTLNRVAEDLTGWTQGEAAGQPLTTVFNIVNEETRQPVENPALRALELGTIVGLANHTILIARDGTERFVDDSAAPIKDERQRTVGAVLVFRDVTEQKLAARRLRESEAQFIQLANAIPQLAWMAQPNGNIDWYNERWYEYTGKTFEEMEGWGWESVHDPDVLPTVLERWQASLHDGDPFDMVFPLKGADGTFRPFLTRVMPLRNEQGEILRWFGTNTDISEQEAAQEALSDFATQLAEADRRKDEFLAMLAHELRNPLVPIRSGLDILSMDSGPHQPTVALMQQQVEHVVRLVDDLLDVSRITQGKIELRKERIELGELIKRSADAVQTAVNGRRHDLTITVPDESIGIDADPVRMTQVFENLLNNACKYTDPGGRISLIVQREQREAVVRIRDTGIGIESELLKNVFHLFTQSSRSLDRAQGGLGIGLTLVQRLVEMHGGTVSAFSEGAGMRQHVHRPTSDRGSSFTRRSERGAIIRHEKSPHPCRR